MTGDRGSDLLHSKGTMLSRWSNFLDEIARFASLRTITKIFCLCNSNTLFYKRDSVVLDLPQFASNGQPLYGLKAEINGLA